MKYSEKYGAFASLLLGFLFYGEKEPPLEDLEIIEECVSELNEEQVKRTLEQAREVLELEPFPEGWIWNTCNYSSPTAGSFPSTKAWIRWVVEKFEEEARRVGKF